MAMFPSSKFEPWLKAEHHAHLSSQLVTQMAEGVLRPFHFTSSFAVVVHQGATKRDANISSVAVKAAPLTITVFEYEVALSSSCRLFIW
jgi:hypothetical protein